VRRYWLEQYPPHVTPAPASPDDARYQELIMAVASKYPGESRHQTALRYILQAEQSKTGSQTLKSTAAGSGSVMPAAIEREGGA
jgi:hypothetical protein